VIDFLPQERRTIVDSKDDTNGGKYGPLPRWPWKQPASQVDPHRISSVRVEQETRRTPEGICIDVCPTHFTFLASATRPADLEMLHPEKDCLDVNVGGLNGMNCYRISIGVPRPARHTSL